MTNIKKTIKYDSRTKLVNKVVSMLIDQTIEKAGYKMEYNIKQRATSSFNQRTGYLRKSVRFKKTGFAEGEVVINPVDEGAEVNYGIHIEYGTKYIAPRAFIRNGVKDTEPFIKELFVKNGKDLYNGNIGIK